MVTTRSRRTAVALPASSRMFDDGGVQERVRLGRPPPVAQQAEDGLRRLGAALPASIAVQQGRAWLRRNLRAYMQQN